MFDSRGMGCGALFLGSVTSRLEYITCDKALGIAWFICWSGHLICVGLIEIGRYHIIDNGTFIRYEELICPDFFPLLKPISS